jgi:hypothetical protein
MIEVGKACFQGIIFVLLFSLRLMLWIFSAIETFLYPADIIFRWLAYLFLVISVAWILLAFYFGDLSWNSFGIGFLIYITIGSALNDYVELHFKSKFKHLF